MHSSPGRFSQLRMLQKLACAITMIGAGVLIGLGIIGYGASDIASTVWMVAAGGFALFLAVMILTITPLLLKIEATLARSLGELRDLHETVSAQAEKLGAVEQNTRISDSAKTLAHRSQELDALREAIREDIRTEQWEAAAHLVEAVESRFGFRGEADRLREELDDARHGAIESKLSEAITLIESHFSTQEWDRAQHEIDRLRHVLPDDARVVALTERMAALKRQHKVQLTADWDEALRRNDTDQAIEVLKGLDPYLTPAEGQALQASARNVFKEKILQLGVQFRFAVKEKRWKDALDTGLEIVRDFPNARMANEVRDNLDGLRARARQTTEAKPAAADRP